MKRLEQLGNLAFIAACLVLTLLAIWRHFGARTPDLPPATRIASAARLTTTDIPTLASADLTVLVGIRSSCRFCTASMPFYRKLIQTAADSHRPVQIVFSSWEPVETTKRYLAEHDVVSKLVSVTVPSTPVRATPTVLLVNRSGEILDGWQGQLNGSQQSEILKRVSSSR